jgi:hypothetical protein
MGIRLLAALLVLTLFGASSGPMVICAANCMRSAEGSVAVHHHQMKPESGRTGMSDQVRDGHHDSACAECPPKSGKSLDQKFDCARLTQIEALSNRNFSLDEPSGIAHFGLTETPAYLVGLAPDGERFSVFRASRKFKNLNFASVPLRI